MVFRKRLHAIHRICGDIIVLCVLTLRHWLSLVSVVNTIWAWPPGNPGVIPDLDKRFFSSLVSRLRLVAIHPFRWVMGFKWSVCKAYRSPPSVVEVKNKLSYTSIAPYASIAYFTLICPHPQCWKCRCCHRFSNCIRGIFSTFSSWDFHEVVRSGLICIFAGCGSSSFIYLFWLQLILILCSICNLIYYINACAFVDTHVHMCACRPIYL